MSNDSEGYVKGRKLEDVSPEQLEFVLLTQIGFLLAQGEGSSSELMTYRRSVLAVRELADLRKLKESRSRCPGPNDLVSSEYGLAPDQAQTTMQDVLGRGSSPE